MLALAVLVTGCTPKPPELGSRPASRVETDFPLASRMNTVNVVDRALLGAGDIPRISVEDTNSRRTATGTLEAWAVLRNLTDYSIQVEGRIQFFDGGRAPVEGPNTWQRVFLPANSTATYRGLSTGVENIAFYYIEIRKGR